MALEGVHHITAITGDAPRNVDFYARLLALRLVKKTVNFDAPDVYHLYYGDERGTPGSILTFFEFPRAIPGRPGEGMVHTIQWRGGAPGGGGVLGGGGGAWGTRPGGGSARGGRPLWGGRGGEPPASRPAGRARRLASRTSRACATSCSPPTCPTRRSWRRRPTCRPSTPCGASTACAR